MDTRTDPELMALAARGDEGAFREIVERWDRPVYAFLCRMLGSTEDAEDVCQETFIRVVQSAGRYRPTGPLRSWIFRIAGNLARSRLRRRKILKWLPFEATATEPPDTTPDIDDTLVREEARAGVRQAIARSPDRQREALILKQFHDLSYQEIAEVMGTTVGSIQMLLHRAMGTLRRDLTAGGWER